MKWIRKHRWIDGLVPMFLFMGSMFAIVCGPVGTITAIFFAFWLWKAGTLSASAIIITSLLAGASWIPLALFWLFAALYDARQRSQMQARRPAEASPGGRGERSQGVKPTLRD